MEEITVEGQVVAILFKNEDNKYYIARIISKETGEEVTISGYFPLLALEQNYAFKGKYIDHRKYGRQFQAVSYTEIRDTSRLGIINYLSSDLFTGIGPATARKIYQAFGEGCIEKILANKNILKQLKFNDLRINRFIEELKLNVFSEKVLIKLLDYGISAKIAAKLISKYNYEAAGVIEKNPYQLIDEVYGIGFLKADEIALKIGVKPESPLRLKEALLYVLNNICQNLGFTYLTRDQLLEAASDFLNRHTMIENNLIIENLDKMIKDEDIIDENGRYYLKIIHKAENIVCQKTLNLLNNPRPEYADADLEKIIKEVENEIKIEYTKSQREAIFKALTNNISIITGGPGTGKTTVLEGFLKTYARLRKVSLNVERSDQVMLMAPTGKAAKRLFDKTGFFAATIHRQLGYDFEGNFEHNETNPLPCDLIIVDEFSMVDIILARHLFSSLKEKCQILIVGDADQLPSVGPGNLLNDLIASKKIPVISLKEIHRQAMDSKIIELSYNIKEGITEGNFISSGKDITYIHSPTDIETNQSVLSCLNQLTNMRGIDMFFDVQVLAPMYKGESGIDNLNLLIQGALNPDINKPAIQFLERIFRKDDKVLQTKNQPDKGIMNGDVGRIIDIFKDISKRDVVKIDFDGNVIELLRDELKDLVHAYAISVHKSQGSEYKFIILPVVRGYGFMLRKKLIYTAVTRAKEHLIIIGDINYLKAGVKRFEDQRQTYMKERLMNFEENSEDLAKNEISPYDFM